MTIKIFCPLFLKFGFLFLLLSSESSVYILDTSPSIVIWFTNIFFQSAAYLFISNSVLQRVEVFSFDRSNASLESCCWRRWVDFDSQRPCGCPVEPRPLCLCHPSPHGERNSLRLAIVRVVLPTQGHTAHHSVSLSEECGPFSNSSITLVSKRFDYSFHKTGIYLLKKSNKLIINSYQRD